MDPSIFGSMQFLASWYPWPALAAFVIALAIAFWVFYDSYRRGLDATVWKVIAALSVILIIPSVVLGFLQPNTITRIAGAVVPLTWLAIAGTVAALVTLVGFVAGLGVGSGAHRCPTCGQELDPTWDRCPYCQPAVATEVAVETYPFPAEPLVAETLPVPEPVHAEPPREPMMPPPDKTMIMNKEKPQLAWLIQLSGVRTGKDWRLGVETNIGREAGHNDIVIDEPRVSRDHARIRLVDGEFILHDLASNNGTTVNDKDVMKQVLHDGDKVSFADTPFYFMEIKQEE